jgi:hypothetical protein
MAIEQKWPAVAPQLFTANGSQHGVIKVESAAGFKVKQKVVVSAVGQDILQLQVKRVIGPDTIIVGPAPNAQTQNKNSLTMYADLTAYTVAASAHIYAEEQDKAKLKPDDILQAVYRQEPGTTIGVEIDDQYGNPIDSVRDNNGINRLAVDGQFHAEVDVQVDVDVDGFYDPEINPDPDNIGLIGHTRSTDTDQTDQVQRITAKRGTLDTDTVSQDVSLHDAQGNAYTTINPVPTSSTYEKFFALIGASNWMKLANYDSVVPSFAGNDLTLAYREDGALLGEAVVTNYTSLNGWDLKLNRYINDDDGAQLLDDDGTPLNLD